VARPAAGAAAGMPCPACDDPARGERSRMPADFRPRCDVNREPSQVAARTMPAEIPPVRRCADGGRTGPNFQMENRPVRDGSQANVRKALASDQGKTPTNLRSGFIPRN